MLTIKQKLQLAINTGSSIPVPVALPFYINYNNVSYENRMAFLIGKFARLIAQ